MTRSEGPHAAKVVAGWLTCVALAIALGCGSSADPSEAGQADTADAVAEAEDASDAEREICDQLQSLVDAIVGQDADGSMRALDELQRAVDDGEPGALRDDGQAFFSTIYGEVPDPGSLTVEQSVEVGDQALRAAQPKLGAMLNTCAALGLAIEDLPTAADRP